MKFLFNGLSFTNDGAGLCSKGSFLSHLTPTRHDDGEEKGKIHLVYQDRVGNSAMGNCATAQLTDEGKASLFKLGLNLHEAYVYRTPFLKPFPVPEELYLRSTEIPRAIESAQNLLHGLFPAWAAGKGAQHVNLDIYIKEEKVEYLFPNVANCRKLGKLQEQAREECKQRQKADTEQLLAKVKDVVPAAGANSVAYLHDSIACAQAHQIPLPKEVTAEVFSEAERLQVDHWWSVFENSEVATRLAIGRVVGDIVDNLKNKAEGKTPLKVPLPSPPLN